MNLKDKFWALQDWFDGVMASKPKFGLFCAISGFVIGVMVAYL